MYPAIMFILYLLGSLLAIHAIVNSRTTHSASAWALFLFFLPMLAIPIYLVFGFRKFQGYKKIKAIREYTSSMAKKYKSKLPGNDDYNLRVLETLSKSCFTMNNSLELLINGTHTFEEIFEAIDSAQKYILVQYYIVRDDDIGRRFKQKLIDAKNRNVDVYFIIDEIGSFDLSDDYVDDLKRHGIHITFFSSTFKKSSRFQINFRNHRKTVVVDGRIGFTGGINLADEYLNTMKSKMYWRDTHLKIEGAAVLSLIDAFEHDWFWCQGQKLNLNYEDQSSSGNKNVLVLSSGPADKIESYELTFIHLIDHANQRIWMATPYFIPDPQVITAIKLAKLRGVDVKILVPEKSDNIFVDYASKSYFEELISCGVEIYTFDMGFMHQKILLIDDEIASVGTANIDNRSFYLNFEMTVFVLDRIFANQIEQMLNADIAVSDPIELSPNILNKFFSKVARLMAPIL